MSVDRDQHCMAASRLPVPVKSLGTLLRSSAISSQKLAVSSLNAASNSLHGCFSEVYEEVALRAAVAADKRFAEGTSLGVLDGIPFAIKDNFCTEFGNTTARCMFLDRGGCLLFYSAHFVILQFCNPVEFQAMFQRDRSSTAHRLGCHSHR